MNTLLSDAEDETTDIKDNFTWDNFTWDIDTDNDDSNNVSFSQADIESVFVTDDNTLAITLTDTAATSLESTTDFDALTDNDSVSITEGFSADTTGNVSTTDSFERDTSIVVFDLLNNESSNHSDRTFESGVSYSIYIVVSNDSGYLNLSPAFEWNDASNLGSDDYIYLVSDGGVLLGENGNSLTKTTNDGVYNTQSGSAVRVYGNGYVSRYTSTSGGSAKIWSSNFSPTIQAGTVSGAYTLTALPEGVMTSQGLA
jgi:hypothetical protein